MAIVTKDGFCFFDENTHHTGQLNITATKKMLYISMRLFGAMRFGTRKCAVCGSKPWELRVKTMVLWGRKPHGFYPEVSLL